ncbi:MAG: response regulator [Patescibacteria group bacterium]|jgi:DNA-binding response OmpR family regulator
MPNKSKKTVKLPSRQSKKNILLVEDDTFLSGMYITKLTLAKFDVTLATDGIQALAVAKQAKPSLILLDVMIPKLDGFGVLRELKKNRNLGNIPVILLTNLSDQVSIEKAKTYQVADYLVKVHYRPDEVIEKVRQVLKKTSRSN